MLSRVKDLLFSPDTFFAQVTTEKEDLNPPIAIIGIAGALNCISMAILLLTAGDYLILLLPMAVIWSLAQPFLTWVIFSLVLHVLSNRYSGTGTFRLTLQNVGYGMLPWAVSHIFSPLTTLFIIGNPKTAINTIQSLSSPNGTLVIFSALAAALMLWTGYLWVYGIMHARQIPKCKAVIAVVILLVLYILVTLGPMLVMYAISR
jgi:hypothetical protein